MWQGSCFITLTHWNNILFQETTPAKGAFSEKVSYCKRRIILFKKTTWIRNICVICILWKKNKHSFIPFQTLLMRLFLEWNKINCLSISRQMRGLDFLTPFSGFYPLFELLSVNLGMLLVRDHPLFGDNTL